MRRLLWSGLILSIIATTGCVSSETHSRALGHVNEARKAATDARNELDSFKKQSSADMDAKEAERARLAGELAATQSALASARSNVENLQGELDARTNALRDASRRLGSIEKEKHAADSKIGSLQVEKDIANARIATLERENEGANNRIASLEKEREEASNRVALLEKDKNALAASVTEARDRVRDLETKVGSLMAQVEGLQNDNRSLLSGTTTAKDVMATLQKRAGDLESESARAADLAQRLNERDQELARLRQASADHDQEIARLRSEVADREQLAGKLAALTDETGKLAQDRERLQQQQTQLSDEHQKLLARLQEDADKLKAEEAEKDRLEKERAAKEEEIRRLTQAQADLTKSLQDEINKGTITIQRVRDRLTINMIDKVLFDSGQAVVKPAGLKVLKQVSDVLKDVPDKQIRIEGHTDNVPIGVKLRDKFATNWELSTTRATSVVRYLIEEGGVNRDMISAAGYADTRPVATNDSDDGKASNRRIEIVLYPKDLTDIAKDLRADSR